MPDVTLEQAAMVLGVSVDTVRRRIRLGQLTAHREATGRSLVTVPAAPALPADIDRLRQQERDQFDALKRDCAHLSETLHELRREQAQLREHNTVLAGLLVNADEAQSELRSLLATAQQQIDRLLPRSDALNIR